MWRRSTKDVDVVAPLAAGGPTVPPAGPANRQRRFDFLMVGLMLALVVVLIAGLVTYARIHDEHEAASAAKADVLQSYLAYYSALEQAFRQLSPAPLEAFVSSADLAQELITLNKAMESGQRVQLTAQHRTQVVLYRGGDLASVDDVMVRHIVVLNETSLGPAGSSRIDTVHQSFTLAKRGRRWVVVSVFAFGFGNPQANESISYAADPSAPKLQPALERTVLGDYLSYWAIRNQSLQDPNAASLGLVEAAPSLAKDESVLFGYRRRHVAFKAVEQHNIRLGQQDGSTVWVYDTYALTSAELGVPSGAWLSPTRTQVFQEAFRLRRFGRVWKVDLIVGE